MDKQNTVFNNKVDEANVLFEVNEGIQEMFDLVVIEVF